VEVVATSCFPFLSSSSLLHFSSSILTSPVVLVVVVDGWLCRAACADAATASIALSTLPLAMRNASLASSRESQGHALVEPFVVALKKNIELRSK
jgi:hypothetical protein